MLERDDVIPAEQVGFRRGHSAEENLGCLIPEVQDGWNRPPQRAASEFHVELLEWEMRGLPPASSRDAPSALHKGPPPGRGRPGSSPDTPRGAGSKIGLRGGIGAEGGPSACAVTEGTAPRRLLTTTGWRDVGARALERAGVQGVPVEERLHITLPLWIDGPGVSNRLDIGIAILRTTPDDARPAAAEEHLASLPDGAMAIWIWCNGSAEGGVAAGGSGALIDPPSGDSTELRAAAGKVCSSTRAMLVAIAWLWKKCVDARMTCP